MKYKVIKPYTTPGSAGVSQPLPVAVVGAVRLAGKRQWEPGTDGVSHVGVGAVTCGEN